MPHIRAAYTLYQRERVKGKPVWYFQTYDEFGRRLPGRSTSKTIKSEARQYCDNLLVAGRLGAGRVPTLSAWVAERHWYEWDRDEGSPYCLYSLGRLKRSDKATPAIGRGHVDRCRRYLEMYIVPHFGAIHLDELKPSALEKWMFDLDADGLASKTIINISSAFRTITAEAARLKIINEDPWKRVSPFYPTSKPRDVLTISEALTLLNPETTKTVWSEGSLNYLVNLTAMLTACRQGEILALRRENIHPDHLDIEASWTIRYHSRGPTKTKRKAPVPIPPYLYKILNDFVQWDGYVFSYTAGQTPATGARITDSLYRAMENIGISEADRRDRNLVFHSWRRFANTYLRGRGLPDAKVRQLTRHESETMTEHYTNWNVESFADVAKEQQSLALALVDPKVRAMLIPDDEETRSE